MLKEDINIYQNCEINAFCLNKEELFIILESQYEYFEPLVWLQLEMVYRMVEAKRAKSTNPCMFLPRLVKDTILVDSWK